jgi:hypothetical protein
MVGDYLRDKTISWKTRRNLLQTGVFPYETRLQKWGKHPNGICGLWKRFREMDLELLGGKPTRQHWASADQCMPSSGSRTNRGSQRLLSTSTRWSSSFNKYKMVLTRRDQGTRIGTLFLGGPRSRWENLCRNTSPHSHSTCRRVWSRLKEKVRGRVNRSARVDSPRTDEVEVKRSFLLRRPDGWVINRKTKKIILGYVTCQGYPVIREKLH